MTITPPWRPLKMRSPIAEEKKGGRKKKEKSEKTKDSGGELNI